VLNPDYMQLLGVSAGVLTLIPLLLTILLLRFVDRIVKKLLDNVGTKPGQAGPDRVEIERLEDRMRKRMERALNPPPVPDNGQREDQEPDEITAEFERIARGGE